ncbi:hypothetical protein [Micromonospora rhizosphaerae]|uniref:hypothetical protein n=1 Tax=Micromonospora rhizosphaerae TaxID=568872 RepID=UPI00159F06D2|nr:hypothetical protein [Micromonospora rhizosphaerae]
MKPKQLWHIACGMPDLVTRTLVVTAPPGHGVPEAGTEFRGHDGHPRDGYGQAPYSRTA